MSGLWAVTRLMTAPIVPRDSSCITVNGEDCSTVNISPGLLVVLVLLGAFAVYQGVRIADLSKKDRQRRRRRQGQRPSERRRRRPRTDA